MTKIGAMYTGRSFQLGSTAGSTWYTIPKSDHKAAFKTTYKTT